MSDRKPFTPESLLEMRGTSDPQLAPDGVRLAYVEHWIENVTKDGKELPAYRTTIMLSDGPDATPRRLSFAATGNDSMPRWSPDGKALAFLSTRAEDKSHLFVLDLAGGEAQPITTPKNLSEGVTGFAWHPNSQVVCLLSQGHKTEEDRKHEQQHDERIYENRLPIKFDGIGFYGPRWTQVWRVERDGTGLAQLTHTEFNITAPQWSPDGKQIVFTSIDQRALEWTFKSDLFVLDLASRETRRLTTSSGPATQPQWSPDGKQIAFLGHQQRRGNATNAALWLISATGGEPRCLSADFDRPANVTTMGDMHWTTPTGQVRWRDESTLLFLASDHGRTGIYQVTTQGETLTQISTSGLSVLQFALANNQLAFTGETNARLGEIYTMSAEGKQVVRRSHAADAIARSFALVAPEHITFKGAEDWDLEGWLIKPPAAAEAAEGTRWPVLLYIHGGPHADYGNGFFHEFQVLAQAGYAIFFVNPRGSASYGETFTDAVRGHFGEQDYADLMRAADLAESWDWVDPKRMGVLGGSYGGYMTNWVVTHTDRFAAACTQRSISNLLSFAGTSDIGPEFSRDEYGGLPWSDEELLMSKSPIRYVQNAKTPTLILHQEEDHRCPMEQAEQFYTALVVLGVPTKFVRFPSESHGLTRNGSPQRRISHMRHIIDWFDRYLK